MSMRIIEMDGSSFFCNVAKKKALYTLQSIRPCQIVELSVASNASLQATDKMRLLYLRLY